ncbi:MAG: PQQ-binding-like beta-propeller repeat protein [Planctomycetota bacterium]
MRFTLFLVLLTRVASVGSVADDVYGGEDWTGWLGPGRDGKVVDVAPPDPWPEALELGWEVEVGEGYATPLVQGGRVFQHARQGDDEVVLCLERATGKEVWRQAFPIPFKIGGGGEAHGKGPKSNPMLDAGRLFTLSIDGTLTGWDANTGAKLWVRDSSEFGAKTPYWGATTSPIAADGKVFVRLGNDESGRLIAFDAASGEEVWSQGDDGAAYASPLIATIDGERQIVEWNHRALAGVEIETGRLLWEFPLPHLGTNQNMPTPSVHRGRVLVGGENRGVFGLQPQKSEDGWDVAVSWHQRDVALDMSSAVVTGDRLFGFSHYDTGRLFCLDVASGEVKWEGPPRTGQNATFLTVAEYVLALINDGRLRVLKATDESYQQVAEYRVADSPTWAAPVLLRSGLLIKSKQKLTFWKFPIR